MIVLLKADLLIDMEAQRVVITGIGTISSVGIGKDDFWRGIVQGRSGVKRVSRIPLKLLISIQVNGWNQNK